MVGSSNDGGGGGAGGSCNHAPTRMVPEMVNVVVISTWWQNADSQLTSSHFADSFRSLFNCSSLPWKFREAYRFTNFKRNENFCLSSEITRGERLLTWIKNVRR